MKIVHAASELYPYMKTGGLADAVAAMAGALADNGHEVSVFLPGYRAVLEHQDAAGAVRKLRLKIEMGDQFLSGDVRVFSPRKNLQVYLICREEFFDRRAPYGNGERDFEDNSDRFVFFCKGWSRRCGWRICGRMWCMVTTGRRPCCRCYCGNRSGGIG